MMIRRAALIGASATRPDSATRREMCSDACLTSWTNVRNFFNPELTGPLPNVVIEETSVEGSENDQGLPCQLPARSSPPDGTPIPS